MAKDRHIALREVNGNELGPLKGEKYQSLLNNKDVVLEITFLARITFN